MLVADKEIPKSKFSEQELHAIWDRLEKEMGQVDTLGRQSQYLLQAYEKKLISWEDALDLYCCAIGLSVAV